MSNIILIAFTNHKKLLIIAAWLYVISILLTFFSTYLSSPEKVVKKLEDRLAKNEKTFSAICADTTLLNTLTRESIVAQEAYLQQLPFGIFVHVLNDVGNPLLTYWNNNQYTIDAADVLKTDGNYFINYSNGSFELVQKTLLLKGQKTIVSAIIPIRWHYFIENKYLHANFDGFKNIETQYSISADKDALPVYNSQKQQLFKIKPKQTAFFFQYDITTILLRTAAILLLIIFLNRACVQIVKQKDFITGFTLLLFAIIVLRLLTYLLPFPFQFSKLGLFDPSVFASNKVHPSLGHLLVNTILLFWVIQFYKSNSVNFPKSQQLNIPVWQLAARLVVLLFITLLVANIIKSLVTDSKISFDVTNFFSLTIYSVVSFIILGFIALLYYYLVQILLKPILANGLSLIYQIFVIVVTGLLYVTITLNAVNVTLNLLIIIWLCLFIIVVNWRKQDVDLPILKSSFFIFWMMILAVSSAIIISVQNKEVEWGQRTKMAERLATQSDPNGENLLLIAMDNFDGNTLAKNFYRFQSVYPNKYLKDSLLNENFSGYLNKFDTRIYTFDSLYNPLFNDDSTSYTILKTIALNKSKATSLGGLYTYQNNQNQLNYLFEKVIENSSEKLGYLFVVVKPKRYKSEALYPELFKQVQDLSIDLNTNYAFAIYVNGKMVTKQNDYDFPLQVNKKAMSAFEYKKINAFGYSELWYNSGSDKQIIITKQDAGFIEIATLFAYLFFTFLILVGCLHIGNYLLETPFTKASVQQLLHFNIRSQIHSTIIFISLFSFLVVGIATISFFINRFNKTNEARLSKTIQVMANEIENKVKQIRTQLLFDDALTINDIGFVNDLERKISEVSEVHNVDINFFSTNGTLIASTQPYIYNKLLLSHKINPTAYTQLHYKKRSRFIQSEHIGSLNFVSVYLPILDEDGHTYAYLNIPYLNSQIELTQEISNFIATLINLNAFVFLIAGAIAFLLTERIISSFKVIAEKMQQVNLSKHNEIITWQRNDEIAPLVNEYNAMVKKLENSAIALAKSEREGAWREMAKQVAHEIKNPLTPMKLSIQYLQKAIDTNAPNTKELSQKVATTLVEQIDQLANIAGNFSQFANINNVQLTTFNVTEVLTSVVALYQHSNGVEISYNNSAADGLITADKLQLNRLFTNLIKNAIEAVTDKTAHIIITQFANNKQVIISIADNGNGIAADMQDKIFTPNFTTKTSGTGLGLAICKGIVENANGTITFITQAEIGTTFTVSLPLVI
ncbi:MAG: GHKL domain-containing protein [Deinococcales bacterium]|nr:GHKL domain-containing protein [Chitinophagaceae bacterium]